MVSPTSFKVLGLNVVVLASLQADPLTSPIPFILVSGLPKVSVVGSLHRLHNLSCILNLVWSVSEHDVAVVIASNIESVVGSCWGNKPSLEPISYFVSNPIWTLKTQSKRICGGVVMELVPVEPVCLIDEMPLDSMRTNVWDINY